MALKPIGSEKLTGQDKINRIMEIATYGETEKNTAYHTQTLSFSKKASDGNTYAIIQEKDGYYLKRGINESELDYIDGINNKKRNRFKSYGAALKRMNLIFKPLNEEFNNGEPTPLYEQSDTENKFVLKTPEAEVDVTDVTTDEVGGEDELDFGDDELEMGDEELAMDDEELDADVVDLDFGDDEMEDEEELAMESLKGRVSQILESYVKKQTPKEYLQEKLNKNKINESIKKLSRSIEQELSVKKYLNENKYSKLKGLTKKGEIVILSDDKNIFIKKDGSIK